MERLAEAIIRATQYINDRGDEHTEDDDVQQLEIVASLLRELSDAEKRILIKVAEGMGLPDWSDEMGVKETP